MSSVVAVGVLALAAVFASMIVGGGGGVEWVVSIFNRRILHNLCLPHLATIDLFEHVFKDFVLDGWRRNKFELCISL